VSSGGMGPGGGIPSPPPDPPVGCAPPTMVTGGSTAEPGEQPRTAPATDAARTNLAVEDRNTDGTRHSSKAKAKNPGDAGQRSIKTTYQAIKTTYQDNQRQLRTNRAQRSGVMQRFIRERPTLQQYTEACQWARAGASTIRYRPISADDCRAQPSPFQRSYPLVLLALRRASPRIQCAFCAKVSALAPTSP
jgi:hypothetical protein